MTRTRYYPAYLLNEQTYEDPESCLDARGIARDEAEQLIQRAHARQSDIVLGNAGESPDEFILLVAEDDGKWRTWAARANASHDTREQAENTAATFRHDVEWRVFGVPA